MHELKCVAATGAQFGKAGYLRPIFEYKGRYLEAGGGLFSSSVLTEMVEEEAAFRLETPLTLKGEASSRESLEKLHSESDVYPFGAYLFYFSAQALACLGVQKMKNMVEKHGGCLVAIAAEEWRDTLLFLIDRERLLSGFVPEVLQLCVDLIDKELSRRFRIRSAVRNSKLVVEDETDELEVLARVMMDITDDDTARLRESIRYYGAVLRLSQDAKNYYVWLDFVLSAWNVKQYDKEYWCNLSDGVISNAKLQAGLLCVQEAYSLSNPKRAKELALEYQHIFPKVEGATADATRVVQHKPDRPLIRYHEISIKSGVFSLPIRKPSSRSHEDIICEKTESRALDNKVVRYH